VKSTKNRQLGWYKTVADVRGLDMRLGGERKKAAYGKKTEGEGKKGQSSKRKEVEPPQTVARTYLKKENGEKKGPTELSQNGPKEVKLKGAKRRKKPKDRKAGGRHETQEKRHMSFAKGPPPEPGAI